MRPRKWSSSRFERWKAKGNGLHADSNSQRLDDFGWKRTVLALASFDAGSLHAWVFWPRGKQFRLISPSIKRNAARRQSAFQWATKEICVDCKIALCSVRKLPLMRRKTKRKSILWCIRMNRREGWCLTLELENSFWHSVDICQFGFRESLR